LIAKASGGKKTGTAAKEKTAISSKLDPKLRLLIEKGQEDGFLTYEELNEALPDDSVSPDRIDQILMILDEIGVEIIDEAEAEERSKKAKTEAEEEENEPSDETTEHVDDPVRMYLT